MNISVNECFSSFSMKMFSSQFRFVDSLPACLFLGAQAMSSSNAAAVYDKFIRFRSYKEQSEEEYKLRWGQILSVANMTKDTFGSRWWKLQELLDDWEVEDQDPMIPPPGKKLKWDIPVAQFGEPAFHTVCDQSPPPGYGTAAATSTLPPPASSALPPPATPPELLDPRVNKLDPSVSMLVAMNREAALAVRAAKLAEERATKEAEAWKISQLG